jgi:hypothetical protein
VDIEDMAATLGLDPEVVTAANKEADKQEAVRLDEARSYARQVRYGVGMEPDREREAGD